jgi:hypothetical protein
VDLRIWLVVADAAHLTALHRTGAERKSNARHSAGLGTNVHILLELLAGDDIYLSRTALVVRIVVADTLASSQSQSASGDELLVIVR